MRSRISFLLLTLLFVSCTKEKVTLIPSSNLSERGLFGVMKLKEALVGANYNVIVNGNANPSENERYIMISQNDIDSLSKEGYTIKSSDNVLEIIGNDASGSLYGCMEVMKRIKDNHKIPEDLDIIDEPEMVLRGTCLGVQKPYYLEGRTVYEYPYTPEEFPWFYDKELWIEYLDMLVENKMNSVYLWNGHPFASLVKLEDYPFAVEVDDETFKKNEEIFAFLTEEADKRGIWVIQMFYNVLVSKPFAEHYNIKTQDRSRPIIPYIADYTRKSVAAFIEKYPNVGLLVCLGEAMDTYEDDVEWFTETIIPGVRDGLEKLGIKEEPPIVVRAHDTHPQMVMDAALPLYSNLYTMHKYNGESLTTYEPRGSWSKAHTDLSSLGSVHISNVHVLANLEPFRWGSPDFIRKSVTAMHNIHGANALHLYPQASYWDWPYSADKTSERLRQMDRDWIWYQAWARYAWSVDRNEDDEINYWSNQLDLVYGTGDASKYIVEAYNEFGEIAPKLLRKFGITEGNRQTLLLGMFMSQLVNPAKWKVYEGFHESCGPEGELLIEYMTKEWNNEKHIGEVPPQLIEEAVQHADKAVAAIEKAAAKVTKNKDEFNRLKNDVYCYQAFAYNFAEKVKAAMCVLRYTHSKDLTDLDNAIPYLEKSLEYYKELVYLTKDTYLYANSMQTAQRRIPIGGDDGTNKTWVELLPHYELELQNYKRNVEFLRQYGENTNKEIKPLKPIEVKLEGEYERYNFIEGTTVFGDKNYQIKSFAEELTNLKGVKLNQDNQVENGTSLTFESDVPVSVIVGFFNTERKEYLKAPTLETDASANEYGQGDVKITNALDLSERGSINIHTFTYPGGKHTLNLAKGGVLVLGFADGTYVIEPRSASKDGSSSSDIDWLFY